MTVLFRADQESLFINYIYSASYSIVSQHYLTPFAAKRDVFHNFFGSEEDDLNRQLRFEILRDTLLKDENKSEVTGDVDHTDGNEEANDSTIDPESAELQLPGQNSLTSENTVDMKEEDGGQLRPFGNRPPMYVSGQQNDDNAVSLAEASRLLSKNRIGRRKPMFTVLSHLGGNQFRKRQADAHDQASMVAALELLSDSRFMPPDNN